MKNNSMLLLMGTLGLEGFLWLLVPALAAVIGVVLSLFMIASWREQARIRHSSVSSSFNVDDFKRRLGASTL